MVSGGVEQWIVQYMYLEYFGQLENTESGNGMRERNGFKMHMRNDLNKWAGQPINGRIEICSIKFVWFGAHCISEKDWQN